MNNGYKKGLELDREENDGNYEPGNCRFVTRSINNTNRRDSIYVVYKSEKIGLMVLLHKLNLVEKRDVIVARLRYGRNLEDALFTSLDKRYTK